MRTKQEILNELEEAVNTGLVERRDLEVFISKGGIEDISTEASRSKKISAVDIMFFVAGIVLFAAILALIGQAWSDENPLGNILLSAGIGAVMWLAAAYMIKNSISSEIRHGLTNSLLLTGSLLIITGGYIIANEIVGGFYEVNYIPSAIALAVVGGLHIGFDRIVKRDLVLLLGILVSVIAFPALMLGILEKSDIGFDIWAIIVVISAALLVYATRIAAKIYPDRKNLTVSLDWLGAFVALLSMYMATFGDYDIAWYGLLIMSIIGIFYLSIIMQNKHLLGNASFFLVVTVVSIAFKYFSGFGTSFSLIMATAGILASAALASHMNKKYFRTQ